MMKKNIFRVLLLVLLIGVLGFAGYEIFAGDAEFVYASNHFNGMSYSSSFIPPEADAIYLLADEDNIVSARFTDTYYWPLTNEVKASWDKRNELVEGQLEILQNGDVIEVLERTDYTIQYDGQNVFETIELYIGDEALLSRLAFEAAQLAYREALQNYNEAYLAYQAELTAFMDKVREENLTVSEDDFPTEPEKAEDMTLFSTELLKGYYVHLPAGNYSVQFRLTDGSVLENSKKDLVVFEAIDDGVGYRVFSEKRWTIDETSTDVSETIYTTSGNRLFLQPYHQRLYNELYYLKMENPQDKSARADKTIWMPFSDLVDVPMNLTKDGDVLTVDEEDYYVQQTKGYTLGYEILVHDPETMDIISFSAHAVNAVNEGDVLTIEMLDDANQSMHGSERTIRVLRTKRSGVVYVVSGLPILLGLGLIYFRRQKVRNEKIVG